MIRWKTRFADANERVAKSQGHEKLAFNQEDFEYIWDTPLVT